MPLDPRHATALELAAAGVHVLPLFGPAEGRDGERGKRPRQAGWQSRANTPEDVTDWWTRHPDSNVGVVCGQASGLVCVDVDPRNGGMAWYEAHRPQLAGAIVERTGSGGLHLWYRHPGGWIVSKTGKHGIADGVELKADGGHQVVIAPSIHPCGQPYAFADGGSLLDVRDFGEALPAWIAAATERQAQRTSAAEDEDYGDRPADLDACRRRLADTPGAIQGEGGDAHTFRVACLGRDFDLSPTTFWPLLVEWNDRCDPPWPIDDLLLKVRNAYRYARAEAPGQASPAKQFAAAPAPEPAPALPPAAAQAQADELTQWEDELLRTENGALKPCMANIDLILRKDPDLRGLLRWNDYACRVEVVTSPWPRGDDGPGWSDIDDTALEIWITKKYRQAMPISLVERAVNRAARANRYNPVREYLDALRWDGKPRLDRWLPAYLGAEDTVYARTVGAKTLIAAVARVYAPGCKVDTILILEGHQGIKKSTAFAILAGEWFSDAALDIESKDAAQLLRGRWIYELAELDTVRRSEITALKSFISRQVDRQRDAYERRVAEVPRHGILVGTTNSEHYLRDESGNRRFWPVAIPGQQAMDLDPLKRDRDQLWAEAVARYRKGEKHWLEPDEESAARAEQSKRFETDEWEQQIQQWLDGNEANLAARQHRVTGAEVWEGALRGNPAHFGRFEQTRVATCMRRLGWVRKPFRRGHALLKGFVRDPSTTPAQEF